MRIASVVTFMSPDGAFGGPTRVATGQAKALARLGHEVTLYAAAPGKYPEVLRVDGYTVKTFPSKYISMKLGFAGMVAPSMLRELRKDLPYIDVAHVHLARDLVTLPAVRLIRQYGKPYFVQPHGMIDRSDKYLAGPIDWWETRIALKSARAVFVLTDAEKASLEEVEPGLKAVGLPNGVEVRDLPALTDRPRRVLFMARFHSIKRPVAFVEMARLIADALPDVQFLMAGPDEGELSSVIQKIESLGLTDQFQILGAIPPAETDDLMAGAKVYVLPSESEVFPMTILEAFRAGTPAVICESFGIAKQCREYDAAIVTDGSINELATAVSNVLTDNALAEDIRRGGHRYLTERLDVRRVAEKLHTAYSKALSHA